MPLQLATDINYDFAIGETWPTPRWLFYIIPLMKGYGKWVSLRQSVTYHHSHFNQTTDSCFTLPLHSIIIINANLKQCAFLAFFAFLRFGETTPA